METIRVSTSHLGNTKKCNAYEFHEGYKGSVSEAAGLGKLRHKAGALWASDWSLKRTMGAIWDGVVMAPFGPGETSGIEANKLQYCRDNLVERFANFARAPKHMVLTIEGGEDSGLMDGMSYPPGFRDPDTKTPHRTYNFAVPLIEGDTRYLITGRHDYVYVDAEAGKIIDWKSKMRPNEFSSFIYAYACHQMYKTEHPDIEQWSVNYYGIADEPWHQEDIIPVKEMHVVREEILFWCREYKRIRDAGFYSQNPGSHCSWCTLADRCPALNTTDLIKDAQKLVERPIAEATIYEMRGAQKTLENSLAGARAFDKALTSAIIDRVRDTTPQMEKYNGLLYHEALMEEQGVETGDKMSIKVYQHPSKWIWKSDRAQDKLARKLGIDPKRFDVRKRDRAKLQNEIDKVLRVLPREQRNPLKDEMKKGRFPKSITWRIA